MKLFKNKFFRTALAVAAVIAIAFTLMSVFGYSSLIKTGLNYVVLPFQKLTDAVGKSLDGYAAYFTEFDKLKKENEELKQKYEDMLSEVQSAAAVKAENDELKKMLEVKEEHLDYKFEPATVVGRENGNYMTVFTLDKGTNHGIYKGMPIISSNLGLIGIITGSGATWSNASSVIEVGSSVGAYNERSLDSGLIEGDYELALNGLCKFSFASDKADVEVGDRILTSGVGSFYPRGLIIGTVVEIKTDENLRTKYAIIKPYAEITELSYVSVLTSFEKYTEE